MRKLLSVLMLVSLVFVGGCSSIKRVFKSEEVAKINDVRVKIETTQGKVRFYLYPEAAPETVANFINLAKRGYFNGMKFHRVVPNFVAQTGDPTGTGSGGPGYSIRDEKAEWLNFYQPGMVAMANKGPGTGGSQFFFTVAPAEWLNGKHTVFGEVRSETDLKNIAKLTTKDRIKSITFEGDADFFLALNKAKVDKWNSVLNRKFPKLKRYPVRSINDPIYAKKRQAYKAELARIFKARNEGKEVYEPRGLAKVIQKADQKFESWREARGKNKPIKITPKKGENKIEVTQ